MPSKTQKDENEHMKYRMTRSPVGSSPRPPVKEPLGLYPDLRAEKENMDFSSSDDSPEKKYPYNISPRMPVKNKSPTSADFMQDTANITRHRNGREQQKRINRFQDSYPQDISPESRSSENSDVEIKTDDILDSNRPHRRLEISETPELNRHAYSTKDPSRLIPQGMQYQTLHTSDTTFLNPQYICSYFPKIFICLIICISFIFSCSISYSYPITSFENKQLNATILVKSLKSNFNDQPHLTFRIIYSALKNVLEPQPKSPAIILLLATNGSEAICRDFALSLVDSLSVPKNTVKISGENYNGANANQAKMDIDKTISKALQTDQLGSVLIYNLDQIPGQAAIILHKYYDHENAPFKKAVFVMTVNYNQPISDSSDTKVWDKAAYDHLLGLWTDSGVDQVTALLSRLTLLVMGINFLRYIAFLCIGIIAKGSCLHEIDKYYNKQ